MDAVHGMSNSGEWETPPDLVADLGPAFGWSLDVCASRANVCENFYSPKDNGLIQHWEGLCWMNPPYGRSRHIDQWMQRARRLGNGTDTAVVCLPPARTSTRWWHDNAPFASLVVLIKGRLVFGSDEYWAWVWEQKMINGHKNGLYQKFGRKQSAPFLSAFVVFGTINSIQVAKLASYGWAVVPEDREYNPVPLSEKFCLSP